MIKGKEEGTWTKKDNSKNKEEGRKEREKGNGGRRKGKSNNKELTYQIKMKCRIGFKINLIYFRNPEENIRKMKGRTKKNEAKEFKIHK